MVIIILAAVLIVAIAYFQVVQGLFSALIMMLLTLLAAGLALNTFDAVSVAVLHARQGPYAEPVALTALFVLPLLITRIAMDLLVAHHIAFPPWVERIVGGLMGLVTGTVLTGMLLIIMQLLPFGESILGYQPYDHALQRKQRAAPFYPDEVAIAVGRMFARGAFAAENAFDAAHKDLLREAFCVRNTAGRNGGIWADPQTAYIDGVLEPNDAVDWRGDVPDYVPRRPGTPTKVVVLQVGVRGPARDRDGWMRLAGTHFRLVTRPKPRPAAGDDAYYAEDAGPTEPASYYPVGYLMTDRSKTRWRLTAAEEVDGKLQVGSLIVERKLEGRQRATVVNWVYRIDAREEPDYLVFRRVCRVPVPKAVEGPPPNPPEKKKAVPPR